MHDNCIRYHKKEAFGKPISTFFQPAYKDLLINAIKKIDSNKSTTLELVMKNDTSGIKIVQLTLSLITDSRSSPEGIIVYSMLTTRHQHPEDGFSKAFNHNNLDLSFNEWKNLLEYIIKFDPNGIVVLDKDMNFLYVSDRFRKDLHLEGTELTGKFHYDILPWIPIRWKNAHQRALRGEVVSGEEEQFKRADGTFDWTKWECRPWYRSDNTIGGIIIYNEIIIKRKVADEALRAREEMLATIIEYSPLPILNIDLDGKVVIWNKAAEKVFGWNAEEVLGCYNPVLHDHKEPEYYRLREQLMNSQGFTGVEIIRQKKNGDNLYVNLSAAPIHDRNNVVISIVAFLEDITERKRAEKKILDSHTLLTKLARWVPGVICQFTLDLNGRMQVPYSSPGIIDVYEVTPEEVRESAEPIFERIYSEDRERVIEAILDSARTLKTFYCEYRVLLPEKGLRWHLSQSHPERTSEGGTLWHGIVTDSTERRNAEDALRESEERYRNLVTYSPDAILINIADKVALVNKECIELFHAHSEADLIGKSIYDFFLPDYHKSISNRIYQLRSLNQVVPVAEGKIIRLDGGIVTVDVLASQFSYRGTKGIHFIIRDITERKIAERRMCTALKEKESLIQEIYHRTKNNMHVISAFLELQAAATENVIVERIVQDSTNRIRTMALAHEMLYKSRSLSKISLKTYITDLARLIASGSGILSERIRLHFDLENIESLIDIAIPCGLIINELLTNSFKYAFPGERSGQIDIKLHSIEHNQIELSVCDNGVGLPEGFDIYNSSTLGLQLVFQIVKHQLHGTVSAQSDHGVCWIIRLKTDLYQQRV